MDCGCAWGCTKQHRRYKLQGVYGELLSCSWLCLAGREPWVLFKRLCQFRTCRMAASLGLSCWPLCSSFLAFSVSLSAFSNIAQARWT